MLVFGFTNGNWTVSMYTDKPDINVGLIAKKYGGGGHVGASGFQCIGELPFELPTKKG
jgi:nanoRNase/pAp phosphatase (c-di-AMP/oligoRNAs hydrolase)